MSAPPPPDNNARTEKARAEDEPRLESQPVVQMLRAANILISRLYHSTAIVTPHRLPPRGAGILVCNHISGLDPLLIQSACPRVIIWMMAAEYYRIPALNWFFRKIEAIPVDRGGRDLAATRAALRALQRGQILGVFPEGRIERTDDLMPFQTGVAMMAIKAEVPIYPAYLDGTQRGKEMVDAFKTPNRSRLAFGRPFKLDERSTGKAELDAATARIKASVESLRQKHRKRWSRKWISEIPPLAEVQAAERERKKF